MIRTRCAILLILLTGPLARASEFIQEDLSTLLTGRAVTTLTNGKLVPWTKGIDGNGLGDGYMTESAAATNGDQNVKSLPGDGCFQATAAHPFIRLNFTDADGKSPQTRSVEGEGEFTIPVAPRQYQRMLVFMTSAEGPSQLHFELAYADGTVEQREVKLPDYFYDAPAGDPDVFSLATDLPKWNAAGRIPPHEVNHHYLHGVDVHPDAARKLVSVRVHKTAPGYLVFWGATGVTAEPPFQAIPKGG